MVKSSKKSFDARSLAVTAMLCALAYVAMFVFKFKVGFLTFDFKDAIISIVSLINGPVMGIVSAFVVALLELVTVSDTGLYGFIMNFLSSGVFALSVGLVYKYKRSFVGALLAAVTAVFSVTAVMLLANLFITPYYMGVERDVVIGMLASMLLPFNLCKSLMNAALMLIIYKPLTTALRKAHLVKASSSQYGFSLKTLLMIIGAVIVIILSALFLILHMEGTFNII